MINVAFLEEQHVVVLEPAGPLSRLDFEDAKTLIDPYIEQYGGLRGLVIHTRDFPGWEDFAGLVSHLQFIHDHHGKIGRVAIVTDSQVGNLAERLAGHFVNALVKSFPYDDVDAALAWVSTR